MKKERPKDGYICRKCWLQVNIFHQFYVRIEQIQGIYYKIDETIDQIKCDLTPCPEEAPDPNIINYDESRTPEISAEDHFDDISVDDYGMTLYETNENSLVCFEF